MYHRVVRGKEQQPKPIDPRIAIIDELIKEQRDNWRVRKHPTDYEQILLIMRRKTVQGEPITYDDLLPVVRGSPNPYSAISKKLEKLHRKFKEKGAKINRPRIIEITISSVEN